MAGVHATRTGAHPTELALLSWAGWALLLLVGCEADSGVALPARGSGPAVGQGLTLVARFAQISDTHIVDTQSPARFPGAHAIVGAAWRPYEAYAAQILDGTIRTVNRIHASGRTIDFLVHTGDACDNSQSNELGWVLGVMDGQIIDPLSGPDDRPPESRPDPLLDPYAAFTAQGLYRAGVHGDQPSIPWYAAPGNHDTYAIGVFPIVESSSGHRTAPLPLPGRPGLVLPVVFNPVGSVAYGAVTPADPGPPPLLERPETVVPNAARAYFSRAEYRQALQGTVTGPAGHGQLEAAEAPSWYSVSPAAGLRLIGLDTTDRPTPVAGGICSEGALSEAQLEFLRGELEAAAERGELVIVATHHPSAALLRQEGSAVGPEELRAVLGAYPNVILHVAGHKHRNRVSQQEGYVEIETCSTLDLPQEGRLIEIWRDESGGRVVISYEMFSHLDDTLPALGDDLLRGLRERAHAIASGDKQAAERQRRFDPSGEDPAGGPEDRAGIVILGR